MISAAEVLAGLTFLEAHAPDAMRGAIHVARGACEQVHAVAKLDEFRRSSAEGLELSIRSAVALAHLGLKTVGDVEEFAALPDEVVFARGKKVSLGKKSLKEIRALMATLGLGRRQASG